MQFITKNVLRTTRKQYMKQIIYNNKSIYCYNNNIVVVNNNKCNNNSNNNFQQFFSTESSANKETDDGLRSVLNGIKEIKTNAKANFDETVEIAIGLGLDPRKPNQNLRGSVTMPKGTGKSERIAVFAQGEKIEEAKNAGAQLVGGENLVDDILKGNIDFTKCIATPDMMPIVGRVARILGPRGLMPNPKSGTITMDVAGAIGAASQGQVEYRVDKFGFLQAGFGKVSFDDEDLIENLRALMLAIVNNKPEGAKGKYLRQATLSTTMGKGVHLDVKFLDASSPFFLREEDDEES